MNKSQEVVLIVGNEARDGAVHDLCAPVRGCDQLIDKTPPRKHMLVPNCHRLSALEHTFRSVAAAVLPCICLSHLPYGDGQDLSAVDIKQVGGSQDGFSDGDGAATSQLCVRTH